MAWYNVANNTTGIMNFINSTQQGMASQSPILGANMIGIAIIVPLWTIIFLPLARYNVGAALVTASFVCWLVSVFLIAIQMINVMGFTAITILLVISAIVFYLNSRQ